MTSMPRALAAVIGVVDQDRQRTTELDGSTDGLQPLSSFEAQTTEL